MHFRHVAAPLCFVVGVVACNAILDNDTAKLRQSKPDATACEPRQCRPDECGLRDDQCGGILRCGECETGICVAGSCTCNDAACALTTCGKLNTACGERNCGDCARRNETCEGNTCQCIARGCDGRCGAQPDDCTGALMNCGGCDAGICGGARLDYCGDSDGGTCVPRKCADGYCGAIAPGCGEDFLINCADCPEGQICGVDAPNRCGCPKRTCEQLGLQCGSSTNACGETIECGGCQAPLTCDKTGHCSCTPITDCGGRTCGTVSDGCGGVLSCGGDNCPPATSCNAQGQCVSNCVPQTQAQACQGRACGTVDAGCGVTFECGLGCLTTEQCIDNKCVCTRRSEQEACADQLCGLAQDGCGGTISCPDRCPQGSPCVPEKACCQHVDPLACGGQDNCGQSVSTLCPAPLTCIGERCGCENGDLCRQLNGTYLCCIPGEICPACDPRK